jgi:hypothetical protein
MKMTLEHFHYLQDAMSINAQYIPQYRAHIIAEGKAKDVEKRLRWDVLYLSGLSKWICDNLYSYLNDEHIDTALRAIMKKIDPLHGHAC